MAKVLALAASAVTFIAAAYQVKNSLSASLLQSLREAKSSRSSMMSRTSSFHFEMSKTSSRAVPIRRQRQAYLYYSIFSIGVIAKFCN